MIARNTYISSLKRVIRKIYAAGRDTWVFKDIEPVFATDVVTAMLLASLDAFPGSENPAAMFARSLEMIMDAARGRRAPHIETAR